MYILHIKQPENQLLSHTVFWNDYDNQQRKVLARLPVSEPFHKQHFDKINYLKLMVLDNAVRTRPRLFYKVLQYDATIYLFILFNYFWWIRRVPPQSLR